MIGGLRNRVDPTPWSSIGVGSEQLNEGGFTLIELLIVCVVLPIIVGAIGTALIAVFSLQGSVSKRLGDSGDAQSVSAFFVSDVQSASTITTDSTPNAPGQCGTGTQLLGLVTGNATEISYDRDPAGHWQLQHLRHVPEYVPRAAAPDDARDLLSGFRRHGGEPGRSDDDLRIHSLHRCR